MKQDGILRTTFTKGIGAFVAWASIVLSTIGLAAFVWFTLIKKTYILPVEGLVFVLLLLTVGVLLPLIVNTINVTKKKKAIQTISAQIEALKDKKEPVSIIWDGTKIKSVSFRAIENKMSIGTILELWKSISTDKRKYVVDMTDLVNNQITIQVATNEKISKTFENKARILSILEECIDDTNGIITDISLSYSQSKLSGIIVSYPPSLLTMESIRRMSEIMLREFPLPEDMAWNFEAFSESSFGIIASEKDDEQERAKEAVSFIEKSFVAAKTVSNFDAILSGIDEYEETDEIPSKFSLFLSRNDAPVDINVIKKFVKAETNLLKSQFGGDWSTVVEDENARKMTFTRS